MMEKVAISHRCTAMSCDENKGKTLMMNYETNILSSEVNQHIDLIAGDDLFGGSEGEWLHDKFAEMEAEGGERTAEEDDNKPSSTTEK